MMGLGHFREIGTAICKRSIRSVSISQSVFCERKVVISTLDENVLGVLCQALTSLNIRSCVHEEFDTRMPCMQIMQCRT